MLKNLARQLTPPLVQQGLKNLFRKTGYFSGPYRSWEEARQRASGYDDPAILAQIKAATLQAKINPELFTQDGLVFSQPPYSYPLLAVLLNIALDRARPLQVLDFGGGLGSTYFNFKKFGAAVPLKWAIVEQPAFVDCGNAHFRDEQLSFHHPLAQVPFKPDVILVSGVLQYIEHPYELLRQLLQLGAGHLVLDRTSFNQAATPDRIVVEHVPAHIYKASYPCWLFDYERLKDTLTQQYRCRLEFYANEGRFTVSGFAVASRGIWLEANKN